MKDDILIEVNNVSKKFSRKLKSSLRYGVQEMAAGLVGIKQDRSKLRKDEFWAVKDVSFQLKRGECLGLIGHNGAGKSTLLKMLNGLIKPDEGEIIMHGRVGALIELGAGFNPILTGRENVYINGQVLGFTKTEIDEKFDAIIDFAEIGEFIDSPVQNYSSGMRVRLGFAVAAQMEPDVLLIDEVLAVGDLSFKMKCYNHIMKIINKDAAIIIVSHSIIDIMRLSSKVNVFVHGRSTYMGSKEKGIGIYNNLAIINEESSHIIQAKLINSVSDFNTENDISFQINVSSNCYISDARIIFHLEYSSTRLSSISTKFKQFDFNISEGENIFVFTLVDVPLLVGGYVAKFELYGKELKDFIDSATPVPFNIVGPVVDYSGFGRSQIISIEHNWQKK